MDEARGGRAGRGFTRRGHAAEFSLRVPFIGSTAVGLSSPERVAQTLDLPSVPISDEVWLELWNR